jgi:hypothetical protein
MSELTIFLRPRYQFSGLRNMTGPGNLQCLSNRMVPFVKYLSRSPKFIWAPVYNCTHWLRPRNPPPPLWAYIRARTNVLLVSQDRRHLFVTPCMVLFVRYILI